MKNLVKIVKKGYCNTIFAVLIAFLFNSVSLYAQDITRFPYNISFRSTIQPTGIVRPNAGTNSAAFTNDGLRLTNTTTQFGAVALDGVSFNSTNGIEIEFEYSMFGGTTFDGSYGDGLSVFLYDASVPLNIGARGAGLGYSYNRAYSPTSARAPGLSGGYLGIGLDEFGNFKGRRYQGDSRVNGINMSWATNSHITLRGAMHPTGLSGGGIRGVGFSGYPVLITRSTKHASSGNLGAVLNATGGGYSALTSIGSGNAFDLRPGSLATTEGAANYRKAFITLLPHIDGGFRVTVRIQHGTTITTVIDNYHYRTSFTYTENANGNTSGSTEQSGGPYAESTHTLNASVPDSFKIGFAASTGGASQTHIIRDLEVSIPYLPEMEGDEMSMCVNYHPSVTIQPFVNDIVYNGALTGIPDGGNTNTYIDFNSFRFENELGNQVGTSTSYTQPNVGIWTYNSSNGQVVFTPVKGYTGSASVNYSIKGFNTNGGPFGQDIYRSATTTIKVDVKFCNTISNPSLPSGKQ